MPVRQTHKTIPSPHLQGDDSWVKIKPVTVEQYNTRQRLLNEATAAAKAGDQAKFNSLSEAIQALVAETIIEWNWVDDDGKPLPQPHKNPKVVDLLTMDEMDFINECIDPYVALQKKIVMTSSIK